MSVQRRVYWITRNAIVDVKHRPSCSHLLQKASLSTKCEYWSLRLSASNLTKFLRRRSKSGLDPSPAVRTASELKNKLYCLARVLPIKFLISSKGLLRA